MQGSLSINGALQGKQNGENPNILIVEGNPDMENIMAEIEKDETRAKRTGTLNEEIKTNPIHLP